MSFEPEVRLVAVNTPFVESPNPASLPLLAVKISTGQAVKHGIEKYLEFSKAPEEKQKAWLNWLKEAKNGFPSVLEHITLTFYINNVSRVFSHQFVRHRLVSITQESQRYTEERILQAMYHLLDYRPKTIEDVRLNDILFDDERKKAFTDELCVLPRFKNVVDNYQFVVLESVLIYVDCRQNGNKMEDCRYLLPQCMKTSLLATANLREWIHIIELRSKPNAQQEFRVVVEKIKNEINKILGFELI
jgi:thymidylate synthase (FAD)